jgi:hypothetical protein
MYLLKYNLQIELKQIFEINILLTNASLYFSRKNPYQAEIGVTAV